jgi:RNA polymerase sigma factor (sigma-70 family)
MARQAIRRHRAKKTKQPQPCSPRVIAEAEEDQRVLPSSDRTAQISREQLKEAVAEAIAKLPPKACEAIELRLIKGLSTREAAEKAGCSVEALYRRLQRAVRQLRHLRRSDERGRFPDESGPY